MLPSGPGFDSKQMWRMKAVRVNINRTLTEHPSHKEQTGKGAKRLISEPLQSGYSLSCNLLLNTCWNSFLSVGLM